MSGKDYLAFTQKLEGARLPALITEITISQNEKLMIADSKIEHIKTNALWDTGASKTCISNRLVEEMKLPVIGMRKTQCASGVQTVTCHIIDIIMPHKIMLTGVPVLAFAGSIYFDILIGMDLITLGDFAITNAKGNTCFSYRTPPNDTHIDFVEKSYE